VTELLETGCSGAAPVGVGRLRQGRTLCLRSAGRMLFRGRLPLVCRVGWPAGADWFWRNGPRKSNPARRSSRGCPGRRNGATM